jgi:NAD(P)-dependent dehydrogenase (short-subunit alcohol dehydrogenase family)
MGLEGKVCVITGATSGIGQVAAEHLARMGVRLVLVARDEKRAAATMARLRACAPAIAYSVHYADLSRIADTKRVAAEVAAAEPRIDLLVNNAGALFSSREVTADGLEKHFAVNHMAYLVLTHGLRERLFAAAPARVVNTASGAHYGARLDLDDLQTETGYNGVLAYQRSKLYNILWTRELARRWAGKGVTVNCFHPGFVATRYGDNAGGLLAYAVRVSKLFAISPEKGARTLIYLATSPEVANVTGGYFAKCRLTPPSRDAENDAAARRLWDVSARLAGIA